eukprot:5144569-Amphidinium_carterae.1
MKAHQTQNAVDNGTVTAAHIHGNGQADLVANQLAPDANWVRWADFAYKRPDSEPRVGLPAEVPAENPADSGIVGMVFPEAPFQLGPHSRVARHAAFLQCLKCGREKGVELLLPQATKLPQAPRSMGSLNWLASGSTDALGAALCGVSAAQPCKR